MGNSTTSLQDVIDLLASMADVSPQANPGQYATNVALTIGNDTMSDLIAQRFNWKWNSALAPSFLTNSWQQDYPMTGISNIGWLEAAWWVDINNTQLPLPSDPMEVYKDLAVASRRHGSRYPTGVCWMYNGQLNYGNWPGPASVYTPLLGTSPTIQNPPMAFIDAAGNILSLTTFGTTGATAPAAEDGAAEGTTVTDGTCVWTVCSPLTMGFRLDTMPGGTGPVFQIHVKFQMKAVKFTSIGQMIDPIPDDYAQHFRKGAKAYAYAYSSDSKTRSQYPAMRAEWLQAMEETEMQGDREPDAFMLIPATEVAPHIWSLRRNPRDPGQPY